MSGTASTASLDYLCRVDIELAPNAPLALGRSPWRNRRVSYIAGGAIVGERLKGEVMSGGGDWSESAADENGDVLTLVDVRSLWRSHDGAIIYVTYSGRLVVPAVALPDFADASKVDSLDASHYYFRIAPTFETSDARYAWLNRKIAIGFGKRTSQGVSYDIHLVR